MVPVINPFTLHRNSGEVPPFDVVAVNVTVVPWHDGLTDDEMAIKGAMAVLTIMVTRFEMAGLAVAHTRSEVIWQETISPFTGT